MRSILFFSKKEFAVIVMVGLVTGLLNDKVEAMEFAFVARTHVLVILNDYLAFKTGGPVFGDVLETWLEYGAVVAACLVRKPAAGTIALTINGICQVFVNGSHDPHLLYGVPGLGVDLVFASFHYKRYDLATVSLAGVACATFWYPIVWFTHGIYLYPISFIFSDLALRLLGSTFGDGLLGGAVALLLVSLAGRKWNALRPSPLGGGGVDPKEANAAGFLLISLGVLLIAVTHASASVSNFFLSIGPKLPPGVPELEEYNLGYVFGVLVIFLVVTMLAFLNFRSAYSEEEKPARTNEAPDSAGVASEPASNLMQVGQQLALLNPGYSGKR